MPSSPDLQLSQQHAAAEDDTHLHTDAGSSQQQLLEAFASNLTALQREVTRRAVVAASSQQPELLALLAADLRRVAAHEQLEQLALALLTSADDQSRPALLPLLDVLLGSDDAPPPLSLLRVTTQRLRAAAALEGPERLLLLRWGDRAAEQLLVTQDASAATEAARLLLALHDAGGASDFKVATLVWKNLTKMSAAFGAAALVDGAFQADDVLASVIAALEQSAQQLCCGDRSEPALALSLKFLRLYWRAFQGQLLCYLSALTSEVEASVMALVNVAASLVDVALLRRESVSLRLQAEASRLLHMAVALAERLGAEADVSAATREQLRVLLWHSDDDMVRAIRQRREEGGASSVEPPQAAVTSIRVGHLLAVAAFGSSDDNVLPAKDTSEEIGGAKLLAAATMLLERFQACAWHEPVGALDAVEVLFLDALLALLVRVDDVEELQLFLIKQLFHPDVARQGIVWEAWREFLCFGWDEDRAAAVLMTLISLAQFETDAKATCWLASGVQLELYELIAFVYPDLPDALKRACIDEATEVIDAIFSEGPSHAFTLQVASQVALLEHLAAASFLKSYDDPEKEAWVAKYLGMCFECCGTVLDLLNTGPAADPAQWGGMMRILDVCLLVAKAILDDSDANGTDLDELAGMLVPMSSEILTQLSKVDRDALSRAAAAAGRSRNSLTLTPADAKLEREASRTLSRILETSTYVLGSLGGVLKRNQNNQFVLALRDLSQILERAPANEAAGTAVSIAWFVSRTLFDVQAAPCDLEVVWQLFARLFQSLSSSAASGEATSGAAGGRMSPHLPLVLAAFYRFVAHSNVAEHAGGSLQLMLHESARTQFRELLALKSLQAPEVDRVFRVELSASHRGGARARLDREFARRFPGDQRAAESDSPVMAKRVRSVAGDSYEDAPGDDETSSSKRRKLDTLAAMCRRAHQMFGATPSVSLLDAVDEQELDAATRLLEQLLASGALA